MGNKNSSKPGTPQFIPSPGSPAAPKLENIMDPFVGQQVVIQGTGRRWAGSTFTATVVDMRTDDDTVKVQFGDGGFKRFPRAQFTDLCVGDGVHPSQDYGSQAYEWYYENYAPDKVEENRGATILADLRKEIGEATRKGDFTTAAKLQETFKTQQANFVEGQKLKEELLSAVQTEDFVKAAGVKDKLVAFRMQRKKSLDAGTKSAGMEAVGSTGSGGKSGGSGVDQAKQGKPIGEILTSAGKRALGGGIAGSMAMVIQVSTLMWMRTAMNYQYRYGTSTMEALRTLYKEGGILRFYRGYLPALAQGPLSRFGDTAANAGVLEILNSNAATASLPAGVKTLGASSMAATWRIFLTPVDTVKTILQVEGQKGINILRDKAKAKGFTVYYHGAMASAAATFAGHYPWFATYNTLQEMVPQQTETVWKLSRNAGIGFCSSVVSDTVSNSLRVVKTYRQTNPETISYQETIKKIVEKDGWGGLFGRGLGTRIAANGMQGMMFSVMWKLFDEKIRAATGQK